MKFRLYRQSLLSKGDQLRDLSAIRGLTKVAF